jgi:outer membrane protein TolC
MDNAHLALGVLLSPDLNEDFTAVDDANAVPLLPSLSEVRSLAARGNPYIRSAVETLRQSQADVTTARSAFLPSLVVDVDYGIEANAFALRSTSAGDPSKGPLPNLGYFVTAALNVPIWNWGATGSKLHQAEYRRKQAQVELSQAQREVLSNLYSYYNETKVARSQIETLREVSGLASETLRLATLRYRSGEALELEVLEAQNTLIAAQKALDDGEVRYRVALATLQTLTGDF